MANLLVKTVRSAAAPPVATVLKKEPCACKLCAHKMVYEEDNADDVCLVEQ